MNQVRNTNYRGRQRGRSRRKQSNNSNAWLIIGGAVIFVLIVLLVIVLLRNKNNSSNSETTSETVETETLNPTGIRGSYTIDLSGIDGLKSDSVTVNRGMNRAEILKAIKKLYTWEVYAVNSSADTGNVVKPTVDANESTAVGSGDVIEESNSSEEEVAALKEIVVTDKLAMPDFIETKALVLIEEIFEDDAANAGENNIYRMDLSGLDEAIEQFAQDADDMWYVEAKGGSIESYDAESDTFLMEGSSDGCKVNKDKLASDLKAQFNKGNYKFSVPVKMETISSDTSVLNGEYQVIAEYVTHTTDNYVRNHNVNLACQKLNGTIVRPGEEFSYNFTIGERTEAKGYGTAAAYANGEVVQEIGGGVCQVSSTLYNAITNCGLKTTYRSPHTFKPTYITPGQDATVSWGGPDFRFANVIALPDISYENTYAIGIKAKYENRTVTVTIYGRPVLKPGYEVCMESELIGEVEVVRETIPEGSDKEPTTGDKGSSWKTYLHITKDGEEVSREVYHTTHYKGHTEYYFETESTDETIEGEETSEGSEEMGPGYVSPSGSTASSDIPGGPSTENSPAVVNDPRINDTPGGLPGSETQAGNGPSIIQDGP